MIVLMAALAVATMASAQDADTKYATRLLKAGTVAPDMAVGTDAAGKTVMLSALRGKYVLINFWASWCPDCRRETPALKAISAAFAAKGLQMAGISYDTNAEAWRKYVSDNGLTWFQYSELKKWKKETVSDRLYNIDWIPTLYLIDPEGKVALATVVMEKMERAVAEAFAAKK